MLAPSPVSRAGSLHYAVMKVFRLLLLTLATSSVMAEDLARRFESDVRVLASEEMEGRGLGTKGIEKAAAWIEARLRHAAEADFAMAFYNPRSSSRPDTFARALDVLRDACGPDRLILFARAVSTPDEALDTVTLAEATPEMADMRTVVIVGNSATRRVGRWVYTPRRAV